jgi:uncharacterized sporulation protein YeaH/YhbH (DUF444 family)
MSIIDSRDLAKGRQAANRKRFIDRHKETLKKKVEEAVSKRSIKDADKGGSISINPDAQPHIDYDSESPRDIVAPGNERYNRGDHIAKPQESGGDRSKASADGEGTDDFEFYMTKEEFMDLYFSDMELPDMIKQSSKAEVIYRQVTGGFTKEGIPPRLAIKKTFETAIARRIANKKSGHKSPFLDDTDLRYIRKFNVAEPAVSAVVFLVMDVSASMTEHHKTLAKKFYIFLYQFLTKFYRNIEMVFIRYHTEAREVDEEEFFKGSDTGGTLVTNAFELAKTIIDKRYPAETNNIYMAHVSDGDMWPGDIRPFERILKEILPNLQYLAYLEVMRETKWKRLSELKETYERMNEPKIGISTAKEDSDIYPALRQLFEKKGVNS